jgi:penicillin-binding protein 1A
MLSQTLATFVAAAGTALSGPLGPLDVPDHAALETYRPIETTRVYLADGTLLDEHYIENRVFVPIEEMPPLLVQAFVSAEDREFYQHDGIDLDSTARALTSNLRALATGSGRLFGASTITQQVAKNLLLSREVTIDRKLREAILAVRLEAALTKEEILEIYLNHIYLGQGAYGVAAAAMAYFGRPMDELTLGEMAYLAGLPKAPSFYHPTRQLRAALARRSYVLGRLADDGVITEAERAAADEEPLTTLVSLPEAEETFDPGYFGEQVRRELIDRYGYETVVTGGLAVRTTMEPALQEIARRALRDGLMAYDRRHGWRGGFAAIDPSLLPDDAGPDAAAVAPVTPESGLDLYEALLALSDPDRMPGVADPTAVPWVAALAEVDTPEGIGSWEVAAVLSVAADAADIGFTDGDTAVLPLEEARWARTRNAGGWVGPTPSRMSDVVSPGDVILVERVPGYDPEGRRVFGLRQLPEVQGAIVALDQRSGRVLAMVGGWDYEASEFNRVTQALRQPGSAFKPIVYTAALEMGFHPESLLLDSPVTVRDAGEVWQPRNYDGGSLGVIPFRTGVERSRNLATVRLLLDIGLEPVADLAERLGVYENMLPYYSTALGAGETTPLALTAAFAMIANGGREIVPTLIDRVQNRRGQPIFVHDRRWCAACQSGTGPEAPVPDLPSRLAGAEQLVDPIAAGYMVSILQGVVTRGTAARMAGLGLPLAGKTGTTNDAQSVWFVGFSPTLTAGVYVGFDDNRSLGPAETGSSVAVPIFAQFMAEALEGEDLPNFPPPPTGIAGGERRDSLSEMAEAGQQTEPAMGSTGTGGLY